MFVCMCVCACVRVCVLTAPEVNVRQNLETHCQFCFSPPSEMRPLWPGIDPASLVKVMVAVTAQCPRRKQCYQYEEQQLCPYIAAESVGSQKANRGTDDRETNDCRARQDPLKTALTKLAASVTPDASEQNSLSKGYFHVPWHNAPPTPPVSPVSKKVSLKKKKLKQMLNKVQSTTISAMKQHKG